MTEFHVHAIGMCRHCGHTDTHSVDKNETEANATIQRIVSDARERGDLPSGFALTEISDGIFRLTWGEHDLILTSMRCEDDYEDCHSAFEDYLTRKLAARKVMELMNKLAGNEENQGKGEQQRVDDVASRLLSQLPNDFLNGLN